MRIGESKSSTKEKAMTTRTAETLTVKTCPDKAGQPDYGEVHAEVFRQIGLEGVQQNDNQQDSRDITEDKKPEKKLAPTKVVPASRIL